MCSRGHASNHLVSLYSKLFSEQYTNKLFWIGKDWQKWFNLHAQKLPIVVEGRIKDYIET